MTLVRQATSFVLTLLCAMLRNFDFELRKNDGHEGLKGKKSDDICISNHSSNRLENELEEIEIQDREWLRCQERGEK